MKKTPLLLLSAVAAFGCTRDTNSSKLLEDIKSNQEKNHKEQMAKQDQLIAAIKGIKISGGGAGAARPQPPRRPRPKPEEVYSIDVAGSPYKGAKDAKVTIVEAFEFA